jgi:hypothetical protein
MSLKHFAWACAFFAYGCFSPDSPSVQTGTDTDVDSDGTSDSMSTGSAVTSVTNASMSSEPSSTSPTQPTTSETMTTGPETETDSGSESSGVEPACGDGVPVAGEFCFDDPPLTVDVGPDAIDVAIADIDVNDALDIVVLHHVSDMGVVTIVEADGVGGFTLGGTMPGPPQGASLQVVDSDGDGDDDVFAVGRYGLMHFRNEATFLSESSVMDYTGNDFYVNEIVVADMDGDDIVDCLTTHPYAHARYRGQLNGSGDWTFPADFDTLPTTTEGASGMIVGAFPFDGDADIDIVGLNQYAANAEVLTNDGGGTFTSVSSPALCAGGARFGEAADFDVDGNIDLVATCDDGDLAIATDDGTGMFATVETLALAGSYRPTVADLDGDGAPDILVTSTTLNRAVVFRNDGAGGFEIAEPQFMADAPVYGAATADLNDDGAFDIVVASRDDPTSRVQIYLATP